MLDTRFESNQEGRPLTELAKYPCWDERRVEIRWHKEWWDGPTDGSILFENVRYWFSFWCDTDAPRNPYYYFVYPLSREEADLADEWAERNEEFSRKWVPLANDPKTKDSEELSAIGAEWTLHNAQLPDFTKREPVAWFCSGDSPSFYGVEITSAEQCASANTPGAELGSLGIPPTHE